MALHDAHFTGEGWFSPYRPPRSNGWFSGGITGGALLEVTVSGAFTMSADPGIYALTGVAATAGIATPADPGSYALTGFAAEMLRGFLLVADPGTYVLTGADASLLAAALMNAEPGVYTVTGAAAIGGITMPANFGVYTISGMDAALVFSGDVAQAVTDYIITWMRHARR